MGRIGPFGALSRAALGAALVFFGFFHGHPWGIPWYEAVLGLAGFPALMASLALVVGHVTSRPLRLTGPAATALNCLLIVALASNRFTGAAVDLFYGVTLLAAAWRGQPGCEATVISNVILRRDDQVGCPVFSPIDHAELRHRSRAALSVGADLSGTDRADPPRDGWPDE